MENKKLFDINNNINTAINLGIDFFKFANGNWLKNNPIPDDYSIYGSFHLL